MMRRIGAFFSGIGAALCTVMLLGSQLSAAGESTVLYDGSLGTRVDEQWFFIYEAINGANPLVAVQATAVFSAPGTLLDTTATSSDFAGYNGAFSPLLREEGFRLSFTMGVESETHSSSDRSGVNVILLSEDLLGVEMAFWENEIWVQEGGAADLFTHAEGIPFDTTTGLVQYDLDLISRTYQLSAGGVPLLAGEVRDYTAWTPPLPGLMDPYETPNFIFIGDNTTSAQGRVLISAVSVTTGTAATASLPAAGLQVEEGAGTAVFTVTLDMPPVLTTTVDYALVPGTAVPGSDFVDAGGTLTFTPGVTMQSGGIILLDDDQFEEAKSLQLQLTGVMHGLLGRTAVALTILNDDPAPYALLLPLFLNEK